ncbi:MAG: RICIN domain-containing protein [Luteibacter sp.]
MRYSAFFAALLMISGGSPCARVVPPATDSRPGGLDVRYLALSELPSVLASTGGEPSAWRTAPAWRGTAFTDAADRADPLIAWVPAAALDSDPARAEALDILSAGMAVLVTAHPGEARHEAAVFGVGARESTVLYQPLADGTLHLHLFEDTADSSARARIAERVVADARRRLAPTRRIRRDTGGDAPPQGVPMKRWGASSHHANGARVAFTATVTRNVSATGGSKVITVKSEAEVIPYRNGGNEADVGDDGSPYFSEPFDDPSRLTVDLTIPARYQMSTWLTWPEGETPRARLLTHHPSTDGGTERKVDDKHTTKTSFGASASPDVMRGLADGKVSVAGKLPLSFSFGREYVDEQSVEMNLKDYSTAFQEFGGAHDSVAAWTFPLADDIAGNPGYFGEPLPTTSRMTPMMRRAGLQTIASWRVDGDYEGLIHVASASNVVNRLYDPQAEESFELDDCDDTAVAGSGKVCHPTHRDFSDGGYAMDTAQPVAAVTMDLSSPFLSRTPTVMLMSLGHENRCLTQVAEATGVSLADCDRSEGNREQQWMLDEFGRYVNRASGLCLRIRDDDDVEASACTQSLAQQWEWRADRVHSKLEGGRRRLHAQGDRVSAAFRPGVDALLPVNATNALLPPWTTYPLKPRKGDYIPGFHFNAAPIPDSYLAFDDVADDQRWATVPLIFGIK